MINNKVDFSDTVMSGGVAVAVMSTYVSKASDAGQKQSQASFGKSIAQDFFIWTYKITISNDSKSPLVFVGHDLTAIGEDGAIRKVVQRHEMVSGHEDVVIHPGSVFESSEIVAMPCRSGILCGECRFRSVNGKKEKVIEVSPVSLDSADSVAMAN